MSDVKKKQRLPYVGLCIILLQLIATIVSLVFVLKLNILPKRYLTIFVTFLVLSLVINTVLQFRRKLHVLGKVLSVIMIALLIAACFYEYHTYKLLNKITAPVYDEDEYIVVVLKESKISEVSQLRDKRIAMCDKLNNEEALKQVKKDIEKDLSRTNITYVMYDAVSYQVDALLNKEVDAIVYNKSFADIINGALPDYEEKVSVIKEYKVKVLVASEIPVLEKRTTASTEPATSDSTEATKPAEVETFNDDLDRESKYVYDPSRDPNAPAGGGYIGGDNTKDNSSKGPITNRSFNILIAGNDAYGSLAGRGRHDVNILMTVNPVTKTILLTNTPRDYYVPIPGVTYSGMRDKLTHAGIYGVWSSVATIQNIYNVDIDYYIRLNFTSFIMLVDAIGGVDVYSSYDFLSFKKGMNHIATGSRALSFARERYSFADGDNQRGRNQMALIEAILNKILSPAIITNYAQLVSTMSNAIQTNLTMDDITSIARMQIDNPASWNITSQALTGYGTYRECYSMPGWSLYVMLPNQEAIDGCRAKIESVLK